MISIPYQISGADGLAGEHRKAVLELLKTWQAHYAGNVRRGSYYEMRTALKDLGISVPDSLKNLEAACGWGYKCVEVMRDHVVFDGFSSADGDYDDLLLGIARRNSMATRVGKSVNSALKYCFALYVVSADDDGHARISAYPPTLATGIYNDVTERLDAGMFVVRLKRQNGVVTNQPDWVDVALPDCLIQIKEDRPGHWTANYIGHGLGRCPMFLMPHNPDDDRPFGTARITREVEWLIDCAIRANVNEEIASAFAASTQKYLLGTDGDAFENVDRWQAFIGSIINVDINSEGQIPQFGQLTQPSMQPLTDHFSNLCKRMSAATGIHVGQFGLMSDNPSSAEAIYAENEPLILKCKGFIKQAKEALGCVALAAAATELGTTYADAEDAVDVGVNFLNPAMPTLAQQTDSCIKLASVAPEFAQTRTFWRMNGFDDDECRTIESEMRRARSRQAVQAALEGTAATEPVAAETTETGEVSGD